MAKQLLFNDDELFVDDNKLNTLIKNLTRPFFSIILYRSV